MSFLAACSEPSGGPLAVDMGIVVDAAPDSTDASVDASLESVDAFLGADGGTTDAGEDRIVTIPSDVPADCSEDVSLAIHQALGELGRGDTLLLPAGACYLMGMPLRIFFKSDLRIEGRGTTLRWSLPDPASRIPGAVPLFSLDSVNNLSIADLTIEGSNDGSDHGGTLTDSRGMAHPVDCSGPAPIGCESEAIVRHGLAVASSADVTLEGCTVQRAWGDGLYVRDSQRVAIESSVIERNGRNGISIVSGSEIRVEHGRIVNSRRVGIEFQPNEPLTVPRVDGVSDVEVHHMRIRGQGPAFDATGSLVVSGVDVHDNTMEGTFAPWLRSSAPDDAPRSDWRVVDNTVLGPLNSDEAGLVLRNTTGVEVERNSVTFAGRRDMTAVRFDGAGDGTVRCNHFAGAGVIVARDPRSTVVAADNTTGVAAPECIDDAD